MDGLCCRLSIKIFNLDWKLNHSKLDSLIIKMYLIYHNCYCYCPDKISFSVILKLFEAFEYIYLSHRHNHHHYHQFNVHFLPRSIKGMDGGFSTTLRRQPAFSNILGPPI